MELAVLSAIRQEVIFITLKSKSQLLLRNGKLMLEISLVSMLYRMQVGMQFMIGQLLLFQERFMRLKKHQVVVLEDMLEEFLRGRMFHVLILL